jgi:hypothetical protein
MFAHALGALDQITDTAFSDYGNTSNAISAMRQRFAKWRAELMRESG